MLYIVATPIGNLEDITYRAVKILKEADYILCEDTRVTSKLLERYKIRKPLISYHQRSRLAKISQIIDRLKEGKILAMVTDAGTPGISDPGNELVARIRIENKSTARDSGDNDNIKIVPIPGVSGVTTLASVAGINLQKFVFLGFPPNKKGRQTFFQDVIKNINENKYPVFYYDSPYRVIKNLQLLKELLPESSSNVKVIIGRELTKKFEEIKVGTVDDILEYYNETGEGLVKGEFVVLVEYNE